MYFHRIAPIDEEIFNTFQNEHCGGMEAKFKSDRKHAMGKAKMTGKTERDL